MQSELVYLWINIVTDALSCRQQFKVAAGGGEANCNYILHSLDDQT